MKLLKAFTLSSMVAAGTVLRETEASASDIAEPKERERRFLGMLAAAAAHHFLGNDVADETASPADFSMEQSENMPEERQRRFWHELAANAAHAVINHYVGDESDSPADQSENMPEERQRRFWGALAHAAGSVARGLLGDEAQSPAENMPEERQRRFWGAVAHAAGQFAKGFMGHETPNAENLHNAYAAMPEHRQRRFWHALAANAAHAVVNHYLGYLNDVWTKKFQYLHT